ncbi:chromate efflux transporter [Hahella sp. CR1]|uniref:chromate efflux transporter n=1 Tax=Hahella sp. CR1 TaxID=2992807 RepID=UPI002443349E|nr:chromate efflux transporter [Hahella sp. CR1]MDG9667794.1 chromate efflux transporter [Hahella sp. CR1]
MNDLSDAPAQTSTTGDIFRAFLKLGLTSFGGPVAHLGYFRDEFVTRRRWLSEESYADLVALCQFLPGPASSQVGFALGMRRGGLQGALAAWTAFTLPSALFLLLFALSADAFAGSIGQSLIHGLKLVAVAVVAQAVWGMARNLCPDRQRAGIALVAVILTAALPSAFGQIGVIALGAGAGLLLCGHAQRKVEEHRPVEFPHGKSYVALATFFLLLLILPALTLSTGSNALALFEAFYRAGALVFGGGHVVLPLLEASVVDTGWVSANSFIAGYGAAQAVPGPLFTFAAYLGASVSLTPNALLGAAISLVAIFLPGMLLVVAVLPHWDRFRQQTRAQAAMAGANAAVVGLLGSALYHPVWTSSILSPSDFAIALTAFCLLTIWKLAPWKVVIATTVAGAWIYYL